MSDEHLTEEKLIEILNKAREEVTVGALYRHAKTGGEYIVTDVVLAEATLKPQVIYRAEYGDEITWARELDAFVDMVELNGKTVPRFVKIEL